MFRPELTDFHSSLTLYRGRSLLWYATAIGSSLLPLALFLFIVWSGGRLLGSGILWGLIALLGAVAVIRWRKALALGRNFRDLRDHPRLAIRREGLVIRSAARFDRGVNLSEAILLPWDQLEQVEVSRKMMMSILVITGELRQRSSETGEESAYELTTDYSEIELGCPVQDAADTITHYLEAPNDRQRLAPTS